jgi:hypothetical protein
MWLIKLSKYWILQALLFILFWYVTPCRAQQFYFKGDLKKDAINFTEIKNLVVIPLYINDKGPFNFILDTGVGPMMITDPDLMDSLDIKASRSIKITGLGKGGEIDAYISNDVSARLGQARISGIPTAILKEDIFGLSNYLGIKIYGLLGYYFFRGFIVEINYSHHRLRFSSHDRKMKIKGEKIPIELNSNKPYLRLSLENPGLGKHDLKMLVDNGASHAISLERLGEQPFPLSGPVISANLGVGMSGPIGGSIGRIETLKIGSFTLNRVLASYPLYDDVAAKVLLKDRNGNLGADVLNKFNVVFDYENLSMYLQKNKRFKKPFEHDMAGIELYGEKHKGQHYFISRIESDSPAEKAGLQVDDEIIQINLIPASSYQLNDINSLFRSGDGKRMILSIFRKGEIMVKIFDLKRRI